MIRAAAIACLLSAAPVAAAAAEPPVQAASSAAPADLDALERAIAGGRLTQARLMLSRLDPRAVEGPRFDLLLGRYYLAQQQDAMALERFQRALIAAPAAPAATGAGIASLRLGRPAEARAYLLKAVASDPRDARAWNALGVIADGLREWDAADHAYRAALAIQPDDPAMLNNHGYSLILRRRFAEAAGFLARASAAAPNDGVIRTNFELAEAVSGQYPPPHQPLPTQPDNEEDRSRRLNNAGYAAWLNGDAAAARALLARAIETRTSHYALAERNLAMVEEGLPK